MSQPSTHGGRPISPAAAKLMARGDQVLAALSPLDAMVPPAPEAARGAAAALAREMQRLRARLGGGRVEFGLFGLPKAGKSTLLNALAGQLVSATDILPETAFPIYLIPASSNGAPAATDGGLRCRVFFHPHLNRLPLELPAEDLGKISREKSIWNPKEVAFAEVPSRTEVLGPGFCFIDTPGLEEFVADYGDSSDRLLNDETDAAILVATPDQAMRDTVKRFLELATRRCPRLWIVLNVDVNALGLNSDGSRSVLGTGEFERLRQRFTERLGDIRGLSVMMKEGSAGLHIFSARAAVDKRFAGAPVESLEPDPACKEFSTLARSARAYADDPAREEHAVKFWRRRLGEFAADTAASITRAGEKERAEKDRLAAAQGVLEARRAEQLRLEAQLKEVLDTSVAEPADSFRAAALEGMGPFFETPLRQAVAAWYRSTDSLGNLHYNVKNALRAEFETVRIRLKTVAGERAGKLAAVLPDVKLPPPEPTWIHPVYNDIPPAAVIGDLQRLPKLLGRAAGIAFAVVIGALGWIVTSVAGLFFDHMTAVWAGLVIGGGLIASWWVRSTTRAQLLTRNWSGWTKKFFLPGDAEHIRGIYEEDLRNFGKSEATAATGWLRSFADKLAAAKKQEESAELIAAREATAKQSARVEVIEKTVAELKRRAEEAD